MDQQVVWYASRSTGLVGLVLLTVSVVFGVLVSGRFVGVRWPRFAVAAVHRNVSLVAAVFVGVHVVSSVVDPYAGIGWLDAFVPFGAVYYPFWLGLGAVAFDLFLAVLVTSLVRRRIGFRWWRVVHWTSYVCWPLAVVHGVGTTPSDFRMGWVLALDLVCVFSVLVAVGWRFTRADGYPRRVS